MHAALTLAEIHNYCSHVIKNSLFSWSTSPLAAQSCPSLSSTSHFRSCLNKEPGWLAQCSREKTNITSGVVNVFTGDFYSIYRKHKSNVTAWFEAKSIRVRDIGQEEILKSNKQKTKLLHRKIVTLKTTTLHWTDTLKIKRLRNASASWSERKRCVMIMSRAGKWHVIYLQRIGLSTRIDLTRAILMPRPRTLLRNFTIYILLCA